MLFKSTGVTLLVLIIPAMAVLGPPPGSRGVIDFRYPDYIVHPRPPCPSEGVFPHPRNCTWYYRCHDVYGIGYYRQHYFECEPGTVFSDELDQCIHPFNPNYPCETRPVSPSPSPSPPPVEDVEDCYDSMIRCKVYLCPTYNNIMRHIGRLCESATFTCANGTEIKYCDKSQFYDVLTRTCVQNPIERGCVDEETFDSTATPATTTTITTTTTTTPSTTTPSADDCFDSLIECREYQCPDSAQTETFCKKAFQTCNLDQVTYYCSDQDYFNYKTSECVSPPSSRGCVEIPDEATVTTEQPTTAVAIDPSLLTFSFTVTCSVEKPRPREERLAQYYCTDFPQCLRGVDTKIELCLKYLQCVRTDNEWKAVVMECPPGLYFSYDNDICTTKPEGPCPFERTNRIK